MLHWFFSALQNNKYCKGIEENTLSKFSFSLNSWALLFKCQHKADCKVEASLKSTSQRKSRSQSNSAMEADRGRNGVGDATSLS